VSSSTPPADWVVLKFGGSSVATAAGWRTIATAARASLGGGLRPLVVCSALSGVSDTLEGLLADAAEGQQDPNWARSAVDALRRRHAELADDLGVDARDRLALHFDALERDLFGAALLAEASPRLRARVMAAGELLSTALGATFLEKEFDEGVAWHDARTLLTTVGDDVSETRRYLAAACVHEPDPKTAERLVATSAAVHLTQGFIAGTPDGQTALLGRGGSDVSAAYLAAKLQAERLEVWSDVPGLFTADPRLVPSARLLRHVGYAEAQELASTGGKVLHPRTIEPARRAGIPIHLRSTLRPEAEGTVISDAAPETGAGVLALSVKRNVPLVSMETPGMWQQVGFLADLFSVFARHGLSVDLVSTSETNVSVTLDPVANALDAGALDGLVADLQPLCDATASGPYAAVSFVGRQLRAVLPELSETLEVLEGQALHLVSQAASDLNFTLVVDADQAERVIREAHARQFGSVAPGPVFGPTFGEVMGREMVATSRRSWWHERREDLLQAAEAGTPRYVYDPGTVREAVRTLTAVEAVDRVLYAIKANPHPELLRIAYEEGLGFDCVSQGEVEHVLASIPEIDPVRILFTPNFAPREEYGWAFERGVRVTLDNLYPLEAWPEVFAGRDLFVRADPGRGQGHHAHVRTAGTGSKFGVPPEALERLRELAEATGARVVGLHAHVGSGVTDPAAWAETAAVLAELAEAFPDVRVLDLGGGLAVPAWASAPAFDVAAAGEHLARFKELNPRFELWLEPGRFVVAEAGVLLARVTQLKVKAGVRFVGIDAGMNSLIRPALYGAYHEIVNLSRLDAPPAWTAEIVGPICESADVLGHARRLPQTEERDVLLVATTGAYGRSMASHYNLREPAAETVLGEGRGKREGGRGESVAQPLPTL
jgi:bifunctional diaminopimelate decarboxylase / aspartate kinase